MRAALTYGLVLLQVYGCFPDKQGLYDQSDRQCSDRQLLQKKQMLRLQWYLSFLQWYREWNQWEARHRDSRCMWWQVYQIFRIQEDLWYTQCVLWKEYRLLCPIPLKNCNDSDHGWGEEESRFLSFDNIYFQISNCSSWMSLLLRVHQRCWIWICLLRGTPGLLFRLLSRWTIMSFSSSCWYLTFLLLIILYLLINWKIAFAKWTQNEHLCNQRKCFTWNIKK